jgi:hypothetical protein
VQQAAIKKPTNEHAKNNEQHNRNAIPPSETKPT